MKRLYNLSPLVLLLLTVGCTHKAVHAQVPVAMAPPIHFQFLNSSGQPLANGKVYSYICGTTTLANTFVDAGGLNQNPDPILLDSTGSPSNGSVQTGIFLSNVCWKFVAFDLNNVQQWSVDNVTTYFALTNSANTWTATQTFSSQIIDTLTDNQMVTGAPGNQMTLDFPPPASNLTLHFPSTADTMVGRATTDTLTGKTLISPTITTPTITNPTINGVLLAGPPATYVSITNGNPTGTGTNLLAKITSAAPSVVAVPSLTDTIGVIGICISGCGTTSSAVIQETGTASCVFDGGTIAGDYVQISVTTPGDCRDAGSLAPFLPLAGQIIGRVLTTNGGAGTYAVALYGPDYRPLSLPVVTYNSASSPGNSSLGNTTMTAPQLNGTYRLSYYALESTAGTGCSTNTTVQVSLTYKDPVAAGTTTVSLATHTIVNNGVLGTLPGFPVTAYTFRTSLAPVYFATYTGGTCATPPAYQIIPILELIGS